MAVGPTLGLFNLESSGNQGSPYSAVSHPSCSGWAAAPVSAALSAAKDKVKAKLALGCCLQIEMKTNR